jgi:hypothetical protein
MIQRPDVRARDAARWSCFILASVALHGLFLLTSGSRGANESAGDAALGASTVEVRLVDPTNPASRVRVESEWTPLQPLPKEVEGSRHPRMLDFLPANTLSREIDESAYLPLSRVTLRPSPMAPIAVPYPAGVSTAASTAAKVVVYIDEDGTVARVALAKDQPASAFALAAKSSFEKARYHPALLDGTPVKVRLIVMVTFEDRQAKR